MHAHAEVLQLTRAHCCLAMPQTTVRRKGTRKEKEAFAQAYTNAVLRKAAARYMTERQTRRARARTRQPTARKESKYEEEKRPAARVGRVRARRVPGRQPLRCSGRAAALLARAMGSEPSTSAPCRTCFRDNLMRRWPVPRAGYNERTSRWAGSAIGRCTSCFATGTGPLSTPSHPSAQRVCRVRHTASAPPQLSCPTLRAQHCPSARDEHPTRVCCIALPPP